MKVAIIRGNTMNRFEMQSYEPLASVFEITGYASHIGMFELDNIRFPVKRLHSLEEYYRILPAPFNGLVYGLTLPHGMNNKLLGLERELGDKDIIHAMETSNGYSYQSARVRHGQKKKLVLTAWENIPFLSTKQFRGWDNLPKAIRRPLSHLTVNDRIVKYVKDHTDIFIAVTERAKIALMIEGVPEERIRVIPVGVDTGKFKPSAADPTLRQRFNLAENDFVALFIGRLVVEKGVHELLYAAKLLSMEPELKHIKFVLAGNGPDKDNIVQMIKMLGIDENVRLIGGFSYEQMQKLYNAADAFVLPSTPMRWWQEQFGMVLIEAMASGLPVISTMSGSIPEVVGDSGILIQPNDPISIYNEVKRLAADASTRSKFSKRGRERAVELFDARVASGRIESVYRELV